MRRNPESFDPIVAPVYQIDAEGMNTLAQTAILALITLPAPPDAGEPRGPDRGTAHAEAGAAEMQGQGQGRRQRQGRGTKRSIETLRTTIRDGSCETFTEPDDPNDTPVLRCPGLFGYSLIVRRVGSGRRSIDVVAPSGKTFPLSFDEIVTRGMFQLHREIEWRVRRGPSETDAPTPVGMIARVSSFDNPKEPGHATRTYWVVVKLGLADACVTHRVLEQASTRMADVYRLADTSSSARCLGPLPRARVRRHRRQPQAH
ncbi:MAG: hypothetical protein IPK13_08445 [Deltaproteobacteria bacterium]|nr:hypothetical protein [Deltaproteobacteria bacterium]